MAFLLAYSIVKEQIPRKCYPREKVGGAERDRTADPLLAKQALSQLSYSPTVGSLPLIHGVNRRALGNPQMVGLDRLELSTSRLSGVRSNHLSYRPSYTYS